MDNILYCTLCGQLPIIGEWEDNWPRLWVQYGVLPGDDKWQDDSKYQQDPNEYRIVMPTEARKKSGRELQFFNGHFPGFIDALKS